MWWYQRDVVPTMTTHMQNALTVFAGSAHCDSHSLSIHASRSPYMLLAYVRPIEAAAAVRWTIYSLESRDSSNGSKLLESSHIQENIHEYNTIQYGNSRTLSYLRIPQILQSIAYTYRKI